MRRLCIAASLAAVLLAGPVQAADTITIVVPFAAGGPVDAAARILAGEMQKELGTTIVIENRGGGGGGIGTDIVARAAPDGRTLLVGSQGSHVINSLLQPQLKYDPVKSFTPIAMIGRAPMLLVAGPELPANDFKSLLTLAKSKQLTYGSAGVGTVMNIAGELINKGAGVNILQVPYRGVAPALPDLMAGRLDILPGDPPVLLPQVAGKKVKPLVVFGAERLAALPDIPTTTELGYPSMVMENWYGLLAPAGLPADETKKLEAAALKAIASPAMQKSMKEGELRGTLDAAQFKTRIESDATMWRKVLPELGITTQGSTTPAK